MNNHAMGCLQAGGLDWGACAGLPHWAKVVDFQIEDSRRTAMSQWATYEVTRGKHRGKRVLTIRGTDSLRSLSQVQYS